MKKKYLVSWTESHNCSAAIEFDPNTCDPETAVHIAKSFSDPQTELEHFQVLSLDPLPKEDEVQSNVISCQTIWDIIRGFEQCEGPKELFDVLTCVSQAIGINPARVHPLQPYPYAPDVHQARIQSQNKKDK